MADVRLTESGGNNEEVKPQVQPDYDIQRRLTIIGRGGCGKTCLLQRKLYEKFSTVFPATPIESEDIKYVMDGKKVELKVFDTSGQDDYSRFRSLTLPISDYVLVCFSIDDPFSYSEVYSTIYYLIKEKAPPGIKVILCATKIDLKRNGNLTTEDGENLKEKIGAMAYFECSAKTGVGVKEIFKYVERDIYKTDINPQKSFFESLFFCC